MTMEINKHVTPKVQKEFSIPLSYRQQLTKHLGELKENDVIKGPLDPDEHLD